MRVTRSLVVYGPRSTQGFEDNLNKALVELQKQGFSVVSITPVSAVNNGWVSIILYS